MSDKILIDRADLEWLLRQVHGAYSMLTNDDQARYDAIDDLIPSEYQTPNLATDRDRPTEHGEPRQMHSDAEASEMFKPMDVFNEKLKYFQRRFGLVRIRLIHCKDFVLNLADCKPERPDSKYSFTALSEDGSDGVELNPENMDDVWEIVPEDDKGPWEGRVYVDYKGIFVWIVIERDKKTVACFVHGCKESEGFLQIDIHKKAVFIHDTFLGHANTKEQFLAIVKKDKKK